MINEYPPDWYKMHVEKARKDLVSAYRNLRTALAVRRDPKLIDTINNTWYAIQDLPKTDD